MRCVQQNRALSLSPPFPEPGVPLKGSQYKSGTTGLEPAASAVTAPNSIVTD
jgi:hypothetical protein